MSLLNETQALKWKDQYFKVDLGIIDQLYVKSIKGTENRHGVFEKKEHEEHTQPSVEYGN